MHSDILTDAIYRGMKSVSCLYSVSTGTDSSTTTKTVVVIAVPCVTLSVILVAVAVSGSVAYVAVRQMHRRASGPVYLGSCRRINTIHSKLNTHTHTHTAKPGVLYYKYSIYGDITQWAPSTVTRVHDLY